MTLQSYNSALHFPHKHLLTLGDYTPAQVQNLLALGLKLKAMQYAGAPHALLSGQSVGMYLSKPSLRTRVSFEVGIFQLGAQPVALDVSAIGMGSREPISDVAAVLSRYFSGLMIRTFAQSDLEALAAGGDWAVINGLTDAYHPCQALADCMTVHECFGTFTGVKLAFIGDGNNVAHSLLLAASSVGLDLTVCTPADYRPKAAIFALAQQRAAQTGCHIHWTDDPQAACEGAQAVYTDVWASMGQEEEKLKREKDFAGFQVTPALMALADKEAIFLHRLPAHRGEEVTAEVIDSPASRVYQEAENRLHAQKAVMAQLMAPAVALAAL